MKPRAIPKVKKLTTTESARAQMGLPMKLAVARMEFSFGRVRSVTVAKSMRRMGRATVNIVTAKLGCEVVLVVLEIVDAGIPIFGILGEIHFAKMGPERIAAGIERMRE